MHERHAHGAPSDGSEGLYLELEDGGCVVGRLELVRPGFIRAILDSDEHGHANPILPYPLAEGVEPQSQRDVSPSVPPTTRPAFPAVGSTTRSVHVPFTDSSPGKPSAT